MAFIAFVAYFVCTLVSHTSYYVLLKVPIRFSIPNWRNLQSVDYV